MKKPPLALRRVSLASVLMSSLTWALEENGCNPAFNRWLKHVRASSILLGQAGEAELRILQEQGLSGAVEMGRRLRFEENQRLTKSLGIPKARDAVTPKLHPVKGKIATDPVIHSRAIMRKLWQQTDSGGFSVGRSRFSVLLELSMDMIGGLPMANRAAIEMGADSLAVAERIIAGAKLELQTHPAELTVERDSYYAELVHATEWMNPMSAAAANS